ncbi:Vacuolar protein sorting-associated protein 35 family protein [Babesia bovis T2Bo]|uniref:Vacuolar protein sorting-associated protein 35 n=1 Tax=Babesia bovis TaxID=5865 RepID=A7AS09_BABBO|nr:Vacuolar protein sorting-associated protein 35 family protein [Babesia bovis T2Bo]EDO07328.1 Vacuolar protein sorting-associated protein 35 family protein [Babesia bovis T2Bo]|eukprot:XP_001610896.1 vacuolar protein sorting-associated protein 35 [Babesia bovis T2Bo]
MSRRGGCCHDDAYDGNYGYHELDQCKLLEESLFYVKEHAYYMRQALDANDLGEALKRGINVISELRTSSLTPTSYYELYMKVFNELQILSDFMGNEEKSGVKLNQLYETVQQSCFILPRLYLLIMAASHCIREGKVSSNEILSDVTELCRGVQHPVRGLFLRYFLIQICKDKLPDSDANNPNGTLESFNFLMSNFKESVRLWIRLNNGCHSLLEQKRCDKQRLELGLLVGTNLVRMAQLEHLDCEFYTQTALPAILEEIESTKDVAAKKYLLDCLIQAFSDEYHLKSLPNLLKVIVNSISTNDCVKVVCTLMNRLSTYFQSSESAGDDVHVGVVFEVFHDHLSTINIRDGITLKCFLELQASFVEFTSTVYPGIIEHVEVILTHVVNVLSSCGTENMIHEPEACESIVKLLTLPLHTLGLRSLDMQHNEPLLGFLPKHLHRNVARAMIDALIDSKLKIESCEVFESICRYLKSLFEKAEYEPSGHILMENQNHVSRFIHTIETYDPKDQFDIYQRLSKRMISQGPMHYRYSISTLICRSLMLVFKPFEPAGESTPVHRSPDTRDAADMALSIFNFVNDLLARVKPMIPEESLKLSMMSAITVNELCGLMNLDMQEESNYMKFGNVCHNFIANCCIIFEEEVVESDSQHRCLLYLISAFCSKITILDPEHQSSMAMRLAKYAIGMLKLEQQCSALAHVASSFANSGDHFKVKWALQRSLTAVQQHQYLPLGDVSQALAPVKVVAANLQNRFDLSDLMEAINQY